MAKLDSLVVDLQVSTAALRQGLDEAKGQLQGFNAHFERMNEQLRAIGSLAAVEFGRRIAGAVLDAGRSLGEFVLHGAELADKMGKLAQSAQVTTEEFSRQAYGARLAGVSAEGLSSAYNHLNKFIGEAAAGSKEQVATFHALGVSLRDANGNVRSSSDLFAALAERFSQLGASGSKAALEMKVFGREGAALDPLFKDGAAGLKAMGDEAERFGLVISSQTARAAEGFNDNIDRLKMGVESVAIGVAANLAPALEQLSGQFLSTGAAASGFKATVDVLSLGIKVVVSGAILFVGKLREVAAELAGVAAVAASLAEGDFAAAAEAWEAQGEQLGKVAAETAAQLNAVWGSAAEGANETARNVHGSADKIVADLKRQTEASKEFERAMREAQAQAKKLAGEHFAETDLAHRNAAVAESSVQQGENHQNSRIDPRRAAELATEGFKDFDDALEQYTQAQIGINNEQAAAAQAKSDLDVEGYDFAMDALESQEEIAKRAAKAIDGFKALEKIDASAAAARIDATLRGLGAIGEHMLSKMGELGAVINSAIQGFQSGGIWGAIIAVFIELLSRFERFQELMDIGNGQLKQFIDMLSDAFNPVIDALRTFMGASGILTTVVLQLLTPIFKQLGKAINGIVPLIMAVADALALFQPIFEFIGQILGPIFELVGYVMRFIGLTILGTMNGLLLLWQGILHIVNAIVKAVTGGQGGQDLDRMLEENQARIDDTQSKMKNLAETGSTKRANDAANESERIGSGRPDRRTEQMDRLAGRFRDVSDSSEKAAKALDKLTGSLTNVPTGFRYQLAAFNATTPETIARGREPGIVHVHVAGGVMTTLQQLTDAVQKGINRSRWLRTGDPVPP